MNKQRSNRAIFVLESPWDLDDTDANRTSVLPFVEGIAKFTGDTEVLYANFYDKTSFTKALGYLSKCRYKNAVAYIAAHGLKKDIGNVNIIDALVQIGSSSHKCNITGVMLGSCFVGAHQDAIQACIEGTNLHWCAGYSSTSDWLIGAMIDCAILANMACLDRRNFASRETLIEAFVSSIAPFSDTFEIGTDEKDKPISLANSLQFVIQPTGRGKTASSVSSLVFARHRDLQLQFAETGSPD